MYIRFKWNVPYWTAECMAPSASYAFMVAYRDATVVYLVNSGLISPDRQDGIA
jgi:hypothetical protein